MGVEDLKPPDIHRVLAASGWIDLGDHAEANAELEQVHPSLQGHPEVLKVRWGIFAASRKWSEAVDLARRLRHLAPNDSFGSIHTAFALHEMKRTQEAFDVLFPAVERFPKCETIPYNLACYTAQLGNLDEARTWLRKAIEVGHPKQVKSMALDDPDLQPLWSEIADF